MAFFDYSGKRVLREPLSTKKFIFINNCNVFLSFLLTFLFVLYFFAFTFVTSGSMLPTLDVGETVFAVRLLGEPKRGDIVAFHPFTEENNYLNAAPEYYNEYYIKRVVGLSGETVEIKNNSVYINDVPLQEDYLPEGLVMDDFEKVIVPEGYYFMMGDNRNASADSRVIGCIPAENIILKGLFHIDSLTSLRLKSQNT